MVSWNFFTQRGIYSGKGTGKSKREIAVAHSEISR